MKLLHGLTLVSVLAGKVAFAQCTTVGGVRTCVPPDPSNQTQINNVINELNSVGQPQKTIRLGAGVFYLNQTVWVQSPYVTIEGSGPANTVIVFTNSNAHGIQIGSQGSQSVFNVAIRNLSVRRNQSYTSDGVGILSFAQKTHISDVRVARFMHGIYLRESPWSNKISGVEILGCRNGIVLDQGDHNNLSISRSSITDNLNYGIWVRSSGLSRSVVISECDFSRNGRSGINIESGYGVIVSGNYFESNEWLSGTNATDPNSNDDANDAQIRIAEIANQVISVTLRDNYFANNFQGAAGGAEGIAWNTSKWLNRANQTLHSWRVNSVSGVSPRIVSSGNYYSDKNGSSSESYVH